MEVEGNESRLVNFDPAVLAALPVHATGEGSAPEDLMRITSCQHPDHDTSVDWRPSSA
jgi:hypothetical protein